MACGEGRGSKCALRAEPAEEGRGGADRTAHTQQAGDMSANHDDAPGVLIIFGSPPTSMVSGARSGRAARRRAGESPSTRTCSLEEKELMARRTAAKSATDGAWAATAAGAAAGAAARACCRAGAPLLTAPAAALGGGADATAAAAAAAGTAAVGGATISTSLSVSLLRSTAAGAAASAEVRGTDATTLQTRDGSREEASSTVELGRRVEGCAPGGSRRGAGTCAASRALVGGDLNSSFAGRPATGKTSSADGVTRAIPGRGSRTAGVTASCADGTASPRSSGLAATEGAHTASPLSTTILGGEYAPAFPC